jgi:hypothetical protein
LAHTDTVATAEYNQELSTRRAQALARWFRSHGLKLPIACAGMGERALKVKTADEVDEPRNRPRRLHARARTTALQELRREPELDEDLSLDSPRAPDPPPRAGLRLEYPAELPISARVADIAAAIREHPC